MRSSESAVLPLLKPQKSLGLIVCPFGDSAQQGKPEKIKKPSTGTHWPVQRTKKAKHLLQFQLKRIGWGRRCQWEIANCDA